MTTTLNMLKKQRVLHTTRFNNESHNHNDAGTFSLYLNTIPVLIDAGVGRGTIIASSSIKTAGYPTAEEYADEVCKNLLPLIIRR